MNSFIVDGLNLAYRCHHAQPALATSKGEPSGMFFGFIRTLMAQKKKYRNFKFVVVWDNRSNRKFEIQPDYKKGRSRLPSTVYRQVEDLMTFLKHAGVEQCDKEGEEGDDVIATVATVLKTEGLVYIYTNDKDMLQLVENGKVIVIKPKVGDNEEKFYDEEAVGQQFGLPPKLIPIYLSFAGDTSDNIIGVVRMQTKLICKLASKHKTLDKIYSSLDEEGIKGNTRYRIDCAKQRVFNNEKLVRLSTNLPDISYKKPSPDKTGVEELLRKYEIKIVAPQDVLTVFENTPNNIRYSDPKPAVKLETYSLFD